MAQHAAVLLDRFEADDKRRKVDKVERQVLGKMDWDGTARTIANEIRDTLGYGYVNVWLVRPERRALVAESEYAIGVTDAERQQLQSEVIPLSATDVRADVVRSRAIEVPPPDDPRFNKTPFERLHAKEYVRVFLPLVASDRVLGVVEAGHLRVQRRHIYEQDVQILKAFVDYAAVALEQWKRGFLDQICHDFRSPILSIRAEAGALSKMTKMGHRLTPEAVEDVCDTLRRNCEFLFDQVVQVEYLLATPLRRFQSGKPGPCNLKEVIAEHLKMFSSQFESRGFIIKKESVHGREPFDEYEPTFRLESQGEHSPGWRLPVVVDLKPSRKVIPSVNRQVVNHVFFNLFWNSINYAKPDPGQFKIEIDDDETGDHIVIYFKDYGMGVPPGLEEKIFEAYFRAAEAKQRVKSTGLGLTISRQALQEIGGDLTLVNNRDPTTFRILLPKRARVMPQ